MPFPALDGGSQVMHFTTKGLLANDIKVKVLAMNPTRNFINVDTLPADYLIKTEFEYVKVDTRIKIFNFIINLFKRESYFIERFLSVDFKNKIQSILEREQFDIIQLEHLYLCKYIETIRKYSNAKIILRPQNIEFIIWERYLLNLKTSLKKLILRLTVSRLKKYEKAISVQLDGIIALTKEDAEVYLSFSNRVPIAIVPMGYDYEKLANYDFHKQYEGEMCFYHLGAMNWLPNIESIKWFFEKVIPLLKQKNIEAKISIAGFNMPEEFYNYQSSFVDVHGAINNPLEFQANKQVMLVPLWSGSGIRAKIIEGLALGKTIISTSIGAQGIEYVDGKNILIADTPELFVSQINKCIQNPDLCKTIGSNARDLSVKNYHSNNTAMKMINFYKDVLEINF